MRISDWSSDVCSSDLQIGETRRRQLGTRGEGEVGTRRRRELVPRADREAIVTAVDAVADILPEFGRNRAFEFDRQVRNAAPRIELVGRGKSIGGAGALAGVDRAAAIVPRRIGVQR